MTAHDSPRVVFAQHGIVPLPSLLGVEHCAEILRAANSPDSVGTRRLLTQDWCRALAAQLRAHPAVSELLPASHRAVQCTYFEKSRLQNWLVPVHQDISIPVSKQIEHPSLHGWSEKEGVVFVHGPVPVLQQLVALRLHLDPCREEDGPLKVVCGTHQHGVINAEAAVRLKQAQGETLCTAEAGDVLLLRPLLLHASSKSTGTGLRRVLHFVFGPPELPFGLQWNDAC